MGGLSGAIVKSIARNASGEILVGTSDGLYYDDAGTLSHYKRDTRNSGSLSGDQIWCVMSDKDDNIWLGTEHGMSIASNSSVCRFIKISSLINTGESNEFLCVFRDSKGNLWLGGTNGIIMQTPDGRSKFFRIVSANGTGAGCVRDVSEDSNGTIWLSTEVGINRYDAASGRFDAFYLYDVTGKHVSNWVYSIRQIGTDLWVGSYLGGVNRVRLDKFGDTGGVLRADFSLRMGKELSNNYVNSMVADKDGNLWILLYDDSNIYRYNVTGKKIRRIDVRKVSGGMPSHMCLDSRGRLWCAYDGGALVIDRNGGTVDVKFPHTGDDAAVLTMAPVGTGVWVSTLNNMWNIDGNTLVPSAVPVPRYAFTAIWDDAGSGNVILGALDEIVEVDKASLSKAQEIGTVRLVMECPEGDDIRLNNLVGNPAGLSVAYDKNVSLLVSTLDYSPDVVQHIEYRLVRKSSDGSEEWIAMPEGAGMISLTGMSPGDYDIQIKTVGSPQSPVVIPLRVGYPYYLSVWAVSLYVLLLLSVIGCILWYVRRRGM